MSADIASKLNADSAADGAPLFVINLCASTSPMALTHPNTPELKRYTFFVSRQREDGRERFRLHMGYFASQEQAESLLSAVRDVYPAAWAGPAPTSGMPKRARVSAVPPLVIAAPSAVAEPQAASPVVSAPVKIAPAAVAPAAIAPAPAAPAPAPAVPAPAAKAPPVLEAMSNVRDVLAQLDSAAVPPATKVAPRPVEAVAAATPTAAVPASMPVPARASPPAAAAVAPAAPAPVVARPVVPPPSASSAVPAAEPVPAAAKVLDASQTLQMLESTSAVPVSTVTMDDELVETSDVRIVTPEDTQTLRDIRLDAQNNAPPTFAVQLVWAVSPIDVGALPHLAIFDAYTLYNVEGSRQGRKWYGLRLGFFSDPHSATQVAHYVRSDYQSVAVVPVALKERDHARGGGVAAVAPRLGDAGAPLKPQADVKLQAQGLDGFELLKDDRPPPEKRDFDDVQAPPAGAQLPKQARERIAAAVNGPRPAASAAGARGKVPVAQPVAPQPASKAAGKPAGKPTGKRVVVRKRPETPMRAAPGAPQPLESTLEILGASTLTIDESREIVNDSAVRKPIEKKSGSRFAKLLNRLSGG